MTGSNSNQHDGRTETGWTRRRALRSIGAGTLGLSALPSIVRGKRPTVLIPAYQRGDEVVEWKEVDEEWDHHLETSFAVTDRLKKRFMDEPHVTGLERTIGDTTIAGIRTNVVTVYTKDGSSNRSIPTEMDGVPIEVQKDPGTVDTAYRRDYDPVPGGVVMNSPSDVATTTCRVKHDGVLHMLTCRHVYVKDDSVNFHRCSNQDIKGTKSSQHGDFYGRVKHHWIRHDVAISERNPYFGHRRFTDRIVDQQGRMAGFVPKKNLDRLKNKYDTVHKRGIATGARNGRILGTGGTNWCGNGNFQDRLVRTSMYQEYGDSGGPVYNVITRNGKKYLVGPATQAKGSNRDSIGAAAYFIRNNTGTGFYTGG